MERVTVVDKDGNKNQAFNTPEILAMWKERGYTPEPKTKKEGAN